MVFECWKEDEKAAEDGLCVWATTTLVKDLNDALAQQIQPDQPWLWLLSNE